MKKHIEGFDVGNGQKLFMIDVEGHIIGKQVNFRLPRKEKKRLKKLER